MNLPSKVGWFELLTKTADELVPMGVDRDKVVALRVGYTGSTRPWSEKWARTVGSWGRVRTAIEIADAIGVEASDVREKARNRKVKFATTDHRRSQADLAVLAYTHRHLDPPQARRALGILEVERRLYCMGMQVVLDESAMAIDEVCEMEYSAYQTLWRTLGLQIGPPKSEVSISRGSLPFSDEELISIATSMGVT